MYGTVACRSVDITSANVDFHSSLTVAEGINNSFGTARFYGTTSAKSLTSNGTVNIVSGSLTTTNGNIYGGSVEGNGWTIKGTLDWTRGKMSGEAKQ